MGFFQGKTVLVTGATGFLGGWICRQLLEQEAKLVTLQRRAKPRSQFALAGFAERAAVVEGSLLGWAPALDFAAGLGRTIAWYRDHQALFS